MMVAATLRKNLESPMGNTERWLISWGKPRAVGNMHVFMTCQIDVVNKQLASLLSWNDPLWETLLGESYILTI